LTEFRGRSRLRDPRRHRCLDFFYHLSLLDLLDLPFGLGIIILVESI
jgi:hypothetical protein